MGLNITSKGLVTCGLVILLLTAISLPIGILVIAPALGQHALNVATMNIPNTTVWGLNNPMHAPDNHAYIFNDVSLKQKFFPLPSKMLDVEFALHILSCEASAKEGTCVGPFQWPEKNMAYFTMPEQHIKHGTNNFHATSNLTVIEDTDDFVYWAFAAILGGFPNGVPLFIVGRPHLHALGIFHMPLIMGKQLNCSYVPDQSEELRQDFVALQESGEAITADRLRGLMSARLGSGGNFPPVAFTCTDAGNMDEDRIEEILQNLTDDKAGRPTHPFTTTTTTTVITTKRITTPAPTTPAVTTAPAAPTTGSQTPGVTTPVVTTAAATSEPAVEAISI